MKIQNLFSPATTDPSIRKTVILIVGSLILVGLVILLCGFVGFIFNLPTNISEIAKSYNQIVLSIVALLGLILGIVSVNISTEEQYQRKIDELKTKYPRNEFDKKIKVIASKSNSGKLYLLDERKEPSTISHIGNRTTYHDLEFDDMRTNILEDQKFNNYPKEPRILTRGIPGT